jgi:16S rRNA (uracil1498-N3)-methyltransferase
MMQPRFYTNEIIVLDKYQNTNIIHIIYDNFVLQHLRVMRMHVGNKISLFNGDGYEHEANIISFTKNSCEVNIISSKYILRKPKINMHLIQAALSSSKMDFIVEKATELGASSMYFSPSQNTNHKSINDGDNGVQLNKRLQKMNTIAISACEQCGCNILPKIEYIKKFDQVLDILKQSLNDKSLILSLNPYSQVKINDIIHKQNIENYTDIYCIIGPEGGFNELEYNKFKASGAIDVALTSNILRTETAGIAILSYLGLV